MRSDSPLLTLDSLGDFTLANFAAVSRRGAGVRIAPDACLRIQARRTEFLRFIDAEPTPWVYNVTGGLTGNQATIFSSQERRALTRRFISAGAVLSGESMPERIVRGVIFCRLANFIEGHAAVRAEVAVAVAAMLEEPLPLLPVHGHGAAGEMSLLSHLFGDLVERVELREKEASALVNGAPVAAALMADTLLQAGPLLAEVISAVAVAIDAFGAPRDAYDPVLGSLWQNPYAARAMALLSAALPADSGAGPRLPQAPVSFRAAPRLLARALRSYHSLHLATHQTIRAVTDNPVIVREGGSLRALSNGGFFDAEGPPLFDDLAGAWADLIRLLEKLASRLAETASSKAMSRSALGRLRGLVWAVAGYAEDAAARASRTPLPGTEAGGGPQNDLLSPVVQAWAKQLAVGNLLSTACAVLRAVAACVGGEETLDPHGLDAALRRRMEKATVPPPELVPPIPHSL
jgi:histidine ammonia-lyase